MAGPRPTRRCWRGVTVVGALAVCVLGGACQASPSGPGTSVVAELGGRWTDVTTGQEVPNADPPGSALVVGVFSSSNRCEGQDNTAILRLAWPPGSQAQPPYDVPSYLRDTEGSLLATVGDGQSDLDVDLPPDAPDPRFVKGKSSIRVTADAAGAYVQRADGHVERWARLVSNTGQCA
jgi:hypothetical protein